MQLIGNQNSLRTCIRPTENVPVLTLEIQPFSSVYVFDTRRALSNEIRVYWDHHLNSFKSIWPVRQEQKPKRRDNYGSGTLHPGQLLSGSHFRLQRRQRT